MPDKTWALLTVLLLSRCATTIKDETFYVDAGPSGAVAVHFLSTGSEIIPKAEWDQEREGMFCMSAEALGDFKSEIEKLCSMAPCNYEIQQKIADFFRRASEHNSIAYQ